MAQQEVYTAPDATPTLPAVRTIGPADLKDALARGLDDFWEMPTTHIVFLSLIYPIAGLFLARMAFGYDVLPLLFPIMAGFALIGPFAGIWLYELSRRREYGLDVHWRHAFDVLRSPSFGSILLLGLLLMAIFIVWIAVAQAIYVATFGYKPAASASVTEFLRHVFTTREGWTLIIVGNGIGFLFALLVLTISVVSFPMLVDRNVGVAGAIVTSIRAVAANPVTMAMWGLIVAVALVLGTLPFLFGLAVVMPVLGHATWHLYRKVVEPDPNPPKERERPEKPPRYAAEFPAALFPWGRQDRP
jgi:uncharacterized membrane protein